MRTWSDDPASIRPMLATTMEAPLTSSELAYEPKYDGIRALVHVEPSKKRTGRRAVTVRLWSRLGNEKTTQFPEVVDAVAAWASQHLDRPVLLDGEIVALDSHGEPVGFQNLQGRIHLKTQAVSLPPDAAPSVALIAFDLLRDGDEDLRSLPLSERRRRLETLLRDLDEPRFRISEQVVGDAREMHGRAEARGWEGLIAKRLESTYAAGRRSPDWRKLKLVRHQTCVIGGWTEPRGSRPFFGALLLGVYDAEQRLTYVGHTGAGFSDAELGRVWKALQAVKSRECPFATVPRTNERPHWVKPVLVAEVKFTEWTADGKLRHPTYLGLRDDVKATDVRKEPDPLHGRTLAVPPRRPATRRAAAARAQPADSTIRGAAARRRKGGVSDGRRRRAASTRGAETALLDRLREIEEGGGNGVLDLPDGGRLEVSNLRKTFWPALKLTKGDLLRHYVRVSSVILPVLKDRPLVLKRFPNGVTAKPFYQHRAPDSLPEGVRVAEVVTSTERRAHFIGGDLQTLLYTAQLASISQDPWFSRIGSLDAIDHVALDLDPPDGLPFARVLDVARWVHDELDALGVAGFPKTSGSGGLHVYVPMPPGTPYEAGLLFCQIVATVVASKHPAQATVERSVKARGRRIYVDYLQNIQGKTLASAYSVRANEFAGVSTPLSWDEVEAGVSPRDFTLANFGDRLAAAGDLWAGLAKAPGADLSAVGRYIGGTSGARRAARSVTRPRAAK